MIKKSEPISMAEMKEYINKEDNENLEGFIKKFTKMTPEKAKELKEKIKGLDNIKIKDEHIVKIIDLLPDNKESINKIFTDVDLEEDEVNKLLETIKEFK